MRNKLLRNLLILIIILSLGFLAAQSFLKKESHKATKLYWFIPDGMRAEENLFTVYKWAQEGKLPNIKKMMDKGSYGYSIPDFPSHTPVNFASLLTGAHPIIHGIADGPMRIEGKTLEKPSVGGFSSVAKKVAPIWTVLENAGKKVALLSIPGSTPPEIKNGITIRGRWGNWGSDDAALIFEPKEKQAEMKNVGKGFRLFYFGDTLTKFVNEKNGPVKEAKLSAHGLDIYAYISNSRVSFSFKENDKPFAAIKQGEWTEWMPVTLTYKGEPYGSNIKLKVIKLWDNGQFRIRVLYNNLNKFVTDPEITAKEMTDSLGPMVDFVDNFPPQLIYEPEDKQAFLDEADMSLDYHRKAAGFIFDNYKPDVFLQDIYTPNQMLTSRWWMRYIDPKSADYTPDKAKKAMDEVLKMYQGLDAIIGEALKHDDGKTLFVLSSDHGIILQQRVMALNNLFANKGWLQFNTDPNGETQIDWANTKVIYLQTNNIYINPQGLAGPYKRGSGDEYESLRKEVIETLKSLQDEKAVSPIAQVIRWEDAPKFFEMPIDRVGDLIIEIAPGFGFSEAVDSNFNVFTDSLVSGNKQAYDPKTNGMQTPFVIMGPGVKKGYKLGKAVSHVDQMPTLLQLMGIQIPQYVQGRVLTEIIK